MIKQIGILAIALVIVVGEMPSQDVQTSGSFSIRGPVSEVTESVRKFEWVAGKPRPQQFLPFQKLVFDEAGLLIERTGYDSSGVRNSRLSLEYDASGVPRRKLYEHYYSGELSSNTVTLYDENGRMSDETVGNAQGQTTARWTRTRENFDEIIRYRQYDNKGWVTQRETTRFDGTGNIVFKESRSSYGGARSWSYLYDSKSRLAKAVFTPPSPNDKSWSVLYEYDPSGRVTAISRLTDEGGVRCINRFSYYPGGQLRSEIEEWYTDELISFTYAYEYDIRGHKTGETYTHGEYAFSQKTDRGYDADGRIVFMRSDDTIGREYSISTYEYGLHGERIMERNNVLGLESGYRMENSYDRQDRLTRSIRYGLNGDVLSTTEQIYTAEGDLSRTIVYNTDGSIRTSTLYRYVYDDHGNWLIKNTFETNNVQERYEIPTEERKRTISYR